MLNLKVPFMKPEAVEHAATELLRKYSKWKGTTPKPPINVDDIVEGYFKLDFALANLKEKLGLDDVLGATWFDEERIRVDESLEGQEGRYSFTLAHEVGHWVLHRPLHEATKVTLPLFRTSNEPEPPAVVCRASQKKAPPEWQADQFAACLLMPAREVRAAVTVLSGERPPVIEGVWSRPEAREVQAKLRTLAAAVILQGGFSNVSNEAMRIRLVELKVVHEQRGMI